MWKKISNPQDPETIIGIAQYVKNEKITLMCSFVEDDEKIINVIPLANFADLPSNSPVFKNLHNFYIYNNDESD